MIQHIDENVFYGLEPGYKIRFSRIEAHIRRLRKDISAGAFTETEDFYWCAYWKLKKMKSVISTKNCKNDI